MTPPPVPATDPTLALTLSGPDRPGVTASLFAALADLDVRVLDLEQIVVRDRLLLAVLISDAPGAADAARSVAAELGMSLDVLAGTGDNRPRRTGRSVVTLLGSPITARQVSALAAELTSHGANVDRIRRLSAYPVTTIALDVSGADPHELRAGLAPLAVEQGVDVSVAPAGLDRQGRRLVVMDVDSTLIQDEVIELIAEHAGTREQVAAITESAMRGELDFESSLRARVATLEGVPEAVLADVLAAVRLTPGARTLVRTLKRLGFTVALVSGGFIEIVRPIADELGIELARANSLEVVDGVLTGRVSGPVVDRAEKARALKEFAAQAGLPLSRTVAIGDGANDLDMIECAGLGVAFNAKPVVRAQADTSISVPNLDAVLFLLGISREEVEEADAQAEASA